MSHKTVATSIVVLCLLGFVSSIVGFFVFNSLQIDVFAVVVLLVGVQVGNGGLRAMKWSAAFMALYALAALVVAIFALSGSSLLYVGGRPMVPSQVPLVVGSTVVVVTWCTINLVALIRLLRTPRLAA